MSRHLALLSEFDLPQLRTATTRDGTSVLMLGDYTPTTPLPVRMAWLHTWSAVLDHPISWTPTETPDRPAAWVVGYLAVRAQRGGITLLARAFLTRDEAQEVEALLEATR
ncbi:hypothetical protein [Streptosporangium saharense]|uniref:hypothetical protein n=1 Tax=Streptosporangium saharense TaxID=1706840 RepID=UPI003331D21B